MRKNVIDLYPEGSDKVNAQIDFTEAQRRMAEAVAEADSARRELLAYIDAHKDEFVTTACVSAPSRDFNGRRCVENAWMDFFCSRR